MGSSPPSYISILLEEGPSLGLTAPRPRRRELLNGLVCQADLIAILQHFRLLPSDRSLSGRDGLRPSLSTLNMLSGRTE